MMKVGIIYSTTNRTTLKAAKILSSKIKTKTQLIPIEKAKTACLLKYDFIILAGSINHGKVQGALKRYISRNMRTLMEKPVGLFINCEEESSDSKMPLNKTFSEQLVSSSFISSNFGYEIDPEAGNIFDRRKANKELNQLKKEGKKIPMLNISEIDNFANYINELNDKRVKA